MLLSMGNNLWHIALQHDRCPVFRNKAFNQFAYQGQTSLLQLKAQNSGVKLAPTMQEGDVTICGNPNALSHVK